MVQNMAGIQGKREEFGEQPWQLAPPVLTDSAEYPYKRTTTFDIGSPHTLPEITGTPLMAPSTHVPALGTPSTKLSATATAPVIA